MKLLQILFVVLCAVAFDLKASQPKPDLANVDHNRSGLFDVGGFKLYLECYQPGPSEKDDLPTLILEQGFGRWGSDGVWQNNIAQLQDDYRVCLYDRAGLGKSEQGPVPFTIDEMAIRLDTLLQNADVAAPYYFAGGSYASYVITSYNKQFPNKVLGTVLIDPPVFGYFYTMATRWPKDFQSDNARLMGQYKFELAVNDPLFEKVPEKVDHVASYHLLKDAQSFGNKPVIVLRSKPKNKRFDPPHVPAEIAQPMTELWDSADSKFSKLSSNVEIIYSESERHHLHIADPELVVSAIQRLTSMTPDSKSKP